MALKKAGVRSCWLFLQDTTSAYGLDLKYKTTFWNGMPLKSKFFDLCEALAQNWHLGAFALCLSVPTR